MRLEWTDRYVFTELGIAVWENQFRADWARNLGFESALEFLRIFLDLNWEFKFDWFIYFCFECYIIVNQNKIKKLVIN